MPLLLESRHLRRNIIAHNVTLAGPFFGQVRDFCHARGVFGGGDDVGYGGGV
jgi:hypothetical protein